MEYKFEDDCLFIYNTKNTSSPEFQSLLSKAKKVILTSQTTDYSFLKNRITDLTISIFTPDLNRLSNLHSLEIDYECDSPFNIKYLPASLKILKIYSTKFNENIDDLPNNLEKLIIFPWCKFNKPLNNLPTKLKILCIPEKFNNQLNNLPNNLEYLEIATQNKNFNYLLDKLPKSLQTLKINRGFSMHLNNLPHNLKTLHLADNGKFNLPIDTLPNLTDLVINGNFNQPINFLPYTLHTLIIESPHFFQPLINLPLNLNTLILGKNTNITYDIVLPENIKKINLFSISTDREIILPENLTHIIINYNLLDKIVNKSNCGINIWKKI